MQNFLINKKIPKDLEAKLRMINSENDPVLFAVVGDLTLNSKYGKNVLLASGSEFTVYDIDKDEVILRIKYSDVEQFYTKRMYGNGILRAVSKEDGKPINIFRFT